MVAASITLWLMFSLFLIVPIAGLPAAMGRVAAILCALELVSLLTWSFGIERCVETTCAPVAQAAGIAARTDIPALAGGFLVLAFARLLRT